MLSVLLGCPLQRGVRKARVYCIWIGILYGCFIPLKLKVSFLLVKRYIRKISFSVGKTFIHVCVE